MRLVIDYRSGDTSVHDISDVGSTLREILYRASPFKEVLIIF